MTVPIASDPSGPGGDWAQSQMRAPRFRRLSAGGLQCLREARLTECSTRRAMQIPIEAARGKKSQGDKTEESRNKLRAHA